MHKEEDLRVAVLTRDFPPSVGGISTHVSGLVGGLRAQGVEVDVLVGMTNSRTLFLPLHISLNRYDLVHAQSGPYGAFVFGVPLVVTVHAPIVDEWTHYAGTNRYVSLPAYVLERLSLRRASSVLAVSKATQRRVFQQYNLPDSKLSVVGNGVEFDRYANVGSVGRVPKRILMVARLEPRKSLHEAFEALAHLQRGSYEVQIVGDGSQKASLIAMAERLNLNVTFQGRVENRELPRIYNQASIFLTTSHSEGFGLTVLEAMASGCAVVVSDIPAHRELVTDGESGLVYHSNRELTKSLQTLLSNGSLRGRLAARGKEDARRFSWENVSLNVLNVYRRVLSGRRR